MSTQAEYYYSPEDIRPWWLIGALMMVLDGLSTWWALTTTPGTSEANPIAVWAFENIGVGWACILKGLIGVFCVWRLAVIAEKGHKYQWMNRTIFLKPKAAWRVRRNARWLLIATAILMFLVVLNNFAVIVLGGAG